MTYRKTSIVIVMMILIIGAGFFIVQYYDAQQNGRQESFEPVSIEVWLHSSELAELFTDYEATHSHPHVEFEIRVFRSYEQLFNELMAAISVNHVPQIAEVSSLYGIGQLAESNALLPLQDRLSPSLWDHMNPDLSSYFKNVNQQWAVPYGASLPVLFYNKNILKYGGMSEPTEIVSWGDLWRGNRVDHENSTNDYWRLVVDRQLPWYFQNLMLPKYKQSSSGWDKGVMAKSEQIARVVDVIHLWRELIFDQRLLDPLRHHLATSDFIDGRAAFFLSSSDRRILLEKYIGGRFPFDMIPLPNTSNVIPKVDGFVLLSSSSEKEQVALEALLYLLDEHVQAELWNKTSKLPARIDVLEKLESELEQNDEGSFIFKVRKQIVPGSPQENDKEAWRKLERLIEEIEFSEEKTVEELVGEFFKD